MFRSTQALVVLLLGLGLSCRGREHAAPATPGGPMSRETGYSTGDAALDALQKEFLPTLEANRKEFVGQTGRQFAQRH